MIEREVIEFVAAADWTDDCRVRVELRKRVTKLSIEEAVLFRAELDAAIAEAQRGADQLRHEHELAAVDRIGIAVHPECVAGKCGNCDGETMAADDSMVPCEHSCHWETISPERAA